MATSPLKIDKQKDHEKRERIVKRILCGAPYDKKIEQRTIRKA